MTDCCDRIGAEIRRIESWRLFDLGNQNLLPYLRDVLSLPAGAFVMLPNSEEIPTLAELLGRVSTPLDSGSGEWWWYNLGQPGKTVLTLPQTPNPLKLRIAINSVVMTPTRDYSLADDQCAFTYGLDIGDLVWAKTYGP
jgi:hypothetical protein